MAYYLPWGARLASAGADPFTWYTDLDKADIPFHAGSGEWGAQSTIDEPSAPTGTMTDVTAANATELATHIYTANRRITLTGNIATATFNSSNIVDVDIIVPSGILWTSPSIGGGGNTVTRLRIRGSTVGSHSGGQIHEFDLQGTGSDVILDGLDFSGSINKSAINLGPSGGFNRGAIVNCRVASAGICITSTCADLVIAGCSVLSGLDTSAETSPTNEEAYGIRCNYETDGNVVVYACDIRSNPARVQSSHARFRCHPDPGIEHVWVANNRFVERVENWIFNVSAGGPGELGNAISAWFMNNEVISDGAGTTGGASVPKLFIATNPDPPGTERDAEWSYCQGNTIKSTDIASDSDVNMAGIENGTSGRSGNTYTSLPGSDPAWGTSIAAGNAVGAGDPSGIDWSP